MELINKVIPVKEYDILKLKEYYCLAEYGECVHNIVTNYIWGLAYPLYIYEGSNYAILVNKYEDKYTLFMPLCKREDLIDVFKDLKLLINGEYEKYDFCYYIEEVKDIMLSVFNGFKAEVIIDTYDYVYLSEKLISFSGKKLQKKRNHLNAFYKDNENNWTYETINEDNLQECLDFLKTWYEGRDAYGIDIEKEGINRAIPHYNEFNLIGGLIRINNKVEAFSIASRLNYEMAQVHIEKANDNYRGLYQAICKEFVSHELSEYKYINREDDMGNENLRKSKLSLQPELLIKKYIIHKE